MNNLDKLFKSSNSNFINFGKGYVKYLSTLLDNLEHDKINECVKILEEARNSNNSIFIIGNGGSASTASHVANDFGLSVLKNSSKNSKKHYKVISLTDNVSVLSAISNDIRLKMKEVGYDIINPPDVPTIAHIKKFRQLMVKYFDTDKRLNAMIKETNKNKIELAKDIKKFGYKYPNGEMGVLQYFAH